MYQKLKFSLKVLKNIFLVSWIWIARKYPLSILPKNGYKKKMDFDAISGMDFILLRRSNEQTAEATFTRFGTLSERAILLKDLPGMSMFLLGGRLKPKHIGFRQIGQGMLDWSGERIYFIDYRHDFEKLEYAVPIYFRFDSIQNREFPYYKIDDKETRKFVSMLQLDVPVVDGNRQFSGRCLISHCPTNLNYWHVELQLLDAKMDPIKNSGKNWATSAIKLALQQVLSVAFEQQPDLIRIPASIFVRHDHLR